MQLHSFIVNVSRRKDRLSRKEKQRSRQRRCKIVVSFTREMKQEIWFLCQMQSSLCNNTPSGKYKQIFEGCAQKLISSRSCFPMQFDHELEKSRQKEKKQDRSLIDFVSPNQRWKGCCFCSFSRCFGCESLLCPLLLQNHVSWKKIILWLQILLAAMIRHKM